MAHFIIGVDSLIFGKHLRSTPPRGGREKFRFRLRRGHTSIRSKNNRRTIFCGLGFIHTPPCRFCEIVLKLAYAVRMHRKAEHPYRYEIRAEYEPNTYKLVGQKQSVVRVRTRWRPQLQSGAGSVLHTLSSTSVAIHVTFSRLPPGPLRSPGLCILIVISSMSFFASHVQ
jgi:hypothetical protein